MTKGVRTLPIYAGIFLISVATLVLEISLTRIFSVSQWYHFAFMVVSIALFGIGGSGTFLAVFPQLLKEEVNKLLIVFSGLFSLSCIGSFIITNQIPFDPFRIAWDSKQIFYLLIYYAVLAIPFFASGACIAIAITKLAEKVSKLYFYNLVGAGIGSLAVLFLFSPLGGSGVVVFSSFLGALAFLSFTLNSSIKNRVIALVLSTLTLALLFQTPSPLKLNISPYKSLNTALTYPGAKILHTQWNSFSRIDVIESVGIRFAPGLSLEYSGKIPPQRGIITDGNNLDAITSYYDMSSLEFIDFLPASLAYHLKEEEKALIINPGGGLNVLIALYNDAKYIDAVEINPAIVDLIKSRYKEYAGNIYENERVRVEVSEGRSFVRRSREKYDIIQLSLTDNLAASSTGVYALSENYLYTTEAFEDYYEHLSEDGILSITRWLLPPPRESVRIVSLAVSALENKGIEKPENHIAVIRSLETITILIKKREFTQHEISKIKEFCKERKFDLVYFPGITQEEVNIYAKFLEGPIYYQMIYGLLSTKDRAQFYDNYLFSIAPVTDEKPFFFHFFKWDKLLPLYKAMGKKWQPFVEGGYLVPVVFAQALVLSLVFIFLPVYTFRKLKHKIEGKFRALAYFLCLGIGYMFIEIALIQKFILFLGQPVYAISIVLFSLLLFSGLGSFTTGKFEAKAGKLKPVIILLSTLALLYLAFLPKVFYAFLGQGLLSRILVSLVLLAPLGFVMGMPFPIGIRLLDRLNRSLIPWAWATNGCASVLSSILSVIIALSFGFSAVLALASVVYLAGLWTILSLRKEGILF